MTPASEQGSPEASFVVGRRSARLSMIIPITIHGTDTSGQAFRENTWTIGVNKQGARIATFHPLPRGSQISVVNPVLGRSAKAKVIWVGEKRFPEDPYEVGVELAEAQNVWGIKFPPEDWQKPSPAARVGRAPEPAGEAASGQAAEKVTAPEPSQPPGTSTVTEKPAAPKESAPPSEEISQFNLALAALSHFSQQAQVTKPPETLEGQPAKPVPVTDSQARAGLQRVANLLEELQEREKSLRLIEERLNAQASRLEASREPVEALLARIEEGGRNWQAELEKARGSIQEASRRAFDSALAELSRSGLEELRQKTQSLVGDLQAQLQQTFSDFQERRAPAVTQELQRKSDELLQLWLRELRAQSAGVLDKLSEQLKAAGVRAVEDAKKQLAGVTQSAEEAVGREAKATLQTMRDLGERLGDSGKALADETAKQLSAVTRATVESLTREARTITQESQDQTRKAVQEFQKRGERELEAHLEKELAQRRETMLKLLAKAAEESTEQALAQVTSKSDQAVKEASDAVYKQVGVGAVALKDWADQARAHLESFLERSVESFQRQIAGLSEGTLEKHRRESEALVEDLRARLQQAARIFQDKESDPLDPKSAADPEKPADPPPLERTAEEDSDPILERLRREQEQALSEATHTFGNKLAEMLEGLRFGDPETGERKS